MIARVIVAAAAVAACGSSSPGPGAAGDTTMTESRSPSGELHPGTITFNDRIDGRTWTEAAADNPPTIAWVDVGGRHAAVVRIEITGTPGYRRITKFGVDGAMLESTTQGRPRPEPKPPIVPVPTPTPRPEE